MKSTRRQQRRRFKTILVIASVAIVVLWRVVTMIHIASVLVESNVVVVDVQPIDKTSNSTLLIQPLAKGTLRRDWKSNPPVSEMAIKILKHQSNCELPVTTFHVDNTYGLGSHLTLWSQAMCNAMHAKARLRTHNPVWLWMDQTLCDSQQAERSPLLCYFPSAEFLCNDRTELLLEASNVTDPRETQNWCPYLRQDKPKQVKYEPKLADFRAASIEYLFRQVSPLVIQEAGRQSGLIFGLNGVPDDLITVHMRWGDKFWEMDLASVQEYVQGVSDMLQQQGRSNQTANIYLATEDPKAKEAFLEAAPKGWTVYVDRTIDELNDYRPTKGNRASHTTKNTKGRAGLVALGSLLVAMEANNYVLTTGSNWSRMMNFLQTNVIDPRCGNCTRMVDLRPGIW
jgi:hypothetical protein